jgi:hypothetical protein
LNIYYIIQQLDDINRIRCLTINYDSSSVESVGLQYYPRIHRLECTVSVECAVVVVVVRLIFMEVASLMKITVCQLSSIFYSFYFLFERCKQIIAIKVSQLFFNT